MTMKLQILTETLAAESSVPQETAAEVVGVVSKAVAQAALESNSQLANDNGTLEVLIDKRDLLETVAAEAQISAAQASEILDTLVRIAAVI